MRLVLVDDHPVVRKGLKVLLEERFMCEVAGEAGTGAEAVDLIARVRPEVAILDVKLPDMSGFQVAFAVKQRSPETRIIMLSMHADEFHVEEALRSGADGYVVKDALENEIIDAVRAVTAGKRYLSKMLDRSADSSAGSVDPLRPLTRREREVFRLIAQGLQNKQIADKLFISLRTVETHRAKIMHKLGLRTPAELIHLAIRRNIISVTP
jgi:two-component system response regulator NreC